MGRLETIVPTEPPAQRAPAVLSRLRAAQRELADLKLQIPERALPAAEGKPGARESLAELRRKISEAEFEIASNSAAREYAERLDEAALVSWIQDVQKLSPDLIVEGIGRDTCCSKCVRGRACMINASDNLAGGLCQHPLIGEGLNQNRHRADRQIMRVYAAARTKLGLPT